MPHLRPARTPLLLVLAGGLADGLLTVAQAFAVGSARRRGRHRPGGDGWQTAASWVVAVVGLRALASYVVDVAACCRRRAGVAALRHRLLAPTPGWTGRVVAAPTGELALLATRGIAAVEPYLTRYLPSLVLAAVCRPPRWSPSSGWTGSAG